MFFRHHRQCVCLFVAACALMTGGCLRQLGLNHSSLTPRMASLENDSTFRSQSSSPQPASAPRARLLAPQFGHSSSAARASGSTNDSNPSAAGHSLKLQNKTAAGSLISGSSNPAASITTASQSMQTWPVADEGTEPSQNRTVDSGTIPQVKLFRLSSSANDSAEQADVNAFENVDPVSPLSPEDFEDPSTPVSQPTRTATFSTAEAPVQEAAVETTQPEDPSVLDRLRGFYDSDSENSASVLIKQQIQKLPSPWSVFRDRTETQSPVEQLEPSDTSSEEVAEALIASTAPAASESLLQSLIESRTNELQAWPRTPSGSISDIEQYRKKQQDLRLLYLVADQPGEAISSISSLPGHEQEFWQELMLAIAQYRESNSQLSDDARFTGTLSQLQSAASRLRRLSSLSIRRLEICSRINSFGRVERFPSNDFDPGDPILLYVEVDNFGTELTPAGTYRTTIDARIQIYADGNSEPIETLDVAGGISDEATSERRDYFQSFELNLPSHLATGRYEIRVLLADRVTGKKSAARTEFQIR